MSVINPYKPPETTCLASDASADKDRLRRIATSQRQINLAVLLYLSIFPANLALTVVSANALWVSGLLTLLVVAVLGLGATAVFKLASIFRGRFVAVIYVLGLFVPILGLLLLLSISRTANRELRGAGIKVGLLGANPSAI